MTSITKTRFSKTTKCRYPFEIHYPTLPADIEEMEEADVAAYLEAKQAADAAARAELPETLIAAARAARQAALAAITVTTQSGKTFDGHDSARSNMLCAITAAGYVNQTSTAWRMADNSVATVTLAEVQEALTLAITRVGEIVVGAA